MIKATVVTEENSVANTTDRGNDKMAVGVIGLASMLIGCWAVVCLVSGIISSGGPVGLLSNLIAAISG